MPPLTQRRNTAYLNRMNHRSAGAGRGVHVQAPPTWTGLAIDLGGSLQQRFRPDDLGVAYLDVPRALIAPLERREANLSRVRSSEVLGGTSKTTR